MHLQTQVQQLFNSLPKKYDRESRRTFENALASLSDEQVRELALLTWFNDLRDRGKPDSVERIQNHILRVRQQYRTKGYG